MVYPGAGIAVSSGSAWTTSYSNANPVPVSVGGTGVTSSTGSGSVVLGTSPTITTPTINGVSNAGTAGSGVVGQVITIIGSNVSLTNGVVTSLGSNTITGGDWDIFGFYTIKTGSGSSLSFVSCGISTSPSTQGTTTGGPYSMSSNGSFSIALPPQPLNVSSSTTYYVTMFAQFSGTCTADVNLYARRRR